MLIRPTLDGYGPNWDQGKLYKMRLARCGEMDEEAHSSSMLVYVSYADRDVRLHNRFTIMPRLSVGSI